MSSGDARAASPRGLAWWTVPFGLALLCETSAAERPKPAPVTPEKMAPLPPAVHDNSLAIGGEDIDARKARTRMTVPVQVNGRGPFHFVVDSGADSSVVGIRVADALHLPDGAPITLNGMTSSSRVARVLVDQLDLGQSSIKNLELPALLERDIGGDGMIGIDVLVEQRLMLDFERRVIKVEDAHQPSPHYDGEIVVTARRQRGQLILTQAKANGRPVDAVIDTGSEITIGNIALRDRLIRRYGESAFTPVAVIGVTGVTANMQLARVAELQLGPVILRDVPIAFADVPPFAVFGLDRQPALLLGTDLMATFRRVSLDFRARKVRFQLRRCEATGILISSSPMSDLSRLSLANGNGEACRR